MIRRAFTFVTFAALALYAVATVSTLAALERGLGDDSSSTVVHCANPYGNPCGPGAACHDTATGFTCKLLYQQEKVAICPFGCSPNEHCTLTKSSETNPTLRHGRFAQGDTALSHCECNPGYYRPESWLPCVEETGEGTAGSGA
jgi:hypothetical protein